MAIPFISRTRINPQNKGAPAKYYPAAACIAEVNTNQLAEEISESTTLTSTDILGVINSLLRIIPKYLMLGYKIRLDTFGAFKLGLKTNCKGYDKAKEVTSNDISGVKILFLADSMMKSRMEKPQFTKLDARFIDDDEEENSSSSSSNSSNPTGD